MKRIAYTSIATAPQTTRSINEIVRQSVQNNRDNDLTGKLICGGSRYFQVLEGPEGAVEAALARIENDTRHRGVSYLSYLTARDRVFSKWALDVDMQTDLMGPVLLDEFLERVRELVPEQIFREFQA